MVINRTSSGDFFRTVDELELSLTQMKALHVLADREERSVKELGEALSLSFPAASRAVDGLVRRGLLERRECLEDRRARLVQLSPEGADAVRRMAEARLAGMTEFVDTLQEADRKALSRALAPILKRISPPR